MFSRRRPEADRAARRARGDRDRERPPARALARAVHRRGAQPARARAARLASRSGCSASRWPPSRRSTLLERDPASAARELARVQRARARRDGGAARGRLRAAARRRWRPKGWRPCCASTSRCCGGVSRRGRSSCRSCDVPRLAPGPATQVLRIAQEALGNALRHSGAERIDGHARRRRRRLFLKVTDDGCGFDPAGPEVRGQRLGLTSMEERATELGGTLTVSSTLGRGHDRAPGGARVIRVLLADDHAVVRQGLRTFLDLQDDIEVVAEAGDGEAAVDAARRTDPDVDPARPRDAPARRRGRAEAPAREPRAGHRAHELRRRRQALRGAARGRRGLSAQGRRAAPSSCARSAPPHDGNAPLSPTIATRVVEEIAHGGGAPAAGRRPHPARARRADPDRPRALEQGIALELGVAEKTVKTHVSHILGKLGLTDRTQAALYAVRHGPGLRRS